MEYTSLFVSLGPWNWLIFAAFMVILEILVPGFFLLFLGIAAAIVGVIALSWEIPWQFQFILFAILSIVGVVFARTFWMGADVQSDKPFLNRKANKLIGRTYPLEQALENGRGKIRVGDSLWSVEGPDLPKGTLVTITETDGMTLHVVAKDSSAT